MKRILMILATVLTTSEICLATMSTSRVRKESRFLTDKMAYELNLSTYQYNDVYEINYDFIASIRYIMDDVIDGYEWALNDYYDYLDMRNDDLRYVLTSAQYGRFLATDYFFRPVYTSGNRWNFRVYITYTNRNLFYFAKPSFYSSYSGAHFRMNFGHASYYTGRYNHSYYTGAYRIRTHNEPNRYITTRRSDFSTVTVRPNTSTRPASSGNNPTRTRTRTTTRRSAVNDELYTTGSSGNNGSSASGRRTGTSSRTRTTTSSDNRGSDSSGNGTSGRRSNRSTTRTTTRGNSRNTSTDNNSSSNSSSVRSSSGGSSTRSSSGSTSTDRRRSTSSGSSRSSRR